MSSHSAAEILKCPLCSTSNPQLNHQNLNRDFWRCSNCDLIFVPTNMHLNSDEEKRQYDHHQNSPTDLNYRKFLSQLADPLLTNLCKPSLGLDFGCGPGPTLSVMLEEMGHHVSLYDQFYHQNETVWDQSYDFITATEVIEHLRHPKEVILKIWHHLKINGILALMTKTTDKIHDFKNWQYMRDPTHICFYGSKTFLFIAKFLHAEIRHQGETVLILKKIPSQNINPLSFT